jgi:hypothetical protein
MKRTKKIMMVLCFIISLSLIMVIYISPVENQSKLESEEDGLNKENDYMVKWNKNNYTLLRTMENSKKPRNLHLISETTYGIYFVDATDIDKLYKTTDEGVNVNEVFGEPGEDIRLMYYDRDNERLYIAYWSGGLGTTLQFSYFELDNADNRVDLDDITSAVVEIIWDLFIIAGEPHIYTRIPDGGNYNIRIYRWDGSWNLDVDQLFSNNIFIGNFGVVSGTKYYFFIEDFITEDVYAYDYESATTTLTKNIATSAIIAANDSLNGVTFDGNDILSLVLPDGAPGTNFHYTYSISGNSFIKGAEHNVALMMDRNTAIGVLEKGFHISEYFVYEINKDNPETHLIKLAEPSLDDIIIAITDTYLITDDAKLYIITDEASQVRSVYLTVNAFNAPSLYFTTNLELDEDITVQFFNDNDVLEFEGKIEDIGDGISLRKYPCKALSATVYDTTHTGRFVAQTIDTIAKGAIDNDPYLYYDATSIPAIVGNHTFEFNATPINEILNMLAKEAAAVWSIDPDGKIWFKVISSLADSGITLTEDDTNKWNTPYIRQHNETVNEVIIYGGLNPDTGLPYESIARNESSILAVGTKPYKYNAFYPDVEDQDELNLISAAILAGDNKPLDAFFTYYNVDRISIGNTMNLKSANNYKMTVADDYIILGYTKNLRTSVGKFVVSTGILHALDDKNYSVRIILIPSPPPPPSAVFGGIGSGIGGGLAGGLR